MGSEVVQKKQSIMGLIASNGVKALAQDLHLSNRQIEKANSSVLDLSQRDNLKSCNPASLVRYVYTIARYDFSRDDCCYPVPYGSTVQAQISYQGYRELAMRTGRYSKIDVVEVYDCDDIETSEYGEPIVNFNKNYLARKQAKVIGYYAYCLDKSEKLIKSVFWTKEECEKHGRKYSKAYGSIWGKEETFAKMAKKTVLKQLLKDVDTSELLNDTKIDQMVMSSDFKKENTYADNPINNVEIFDATEQPAEEKKTTVKNTIAKPKEEPKTIVESKQDSIEDFLDEVTGN